MLENLPDLAKELNAQESECKNCGSTERVVVCNGCYHLPPVSDIAKLRIWSKKVFVSVLYARGSITLEQKEEILIWLQGGVISTD